MTEEDLDSEALVFRQIDRIMRTASMDLESMSSGQAGHRALDTDTWSHRVFFSAQFFHAFLRPSMDEEEYNEILEYASENSGSFKGNAFNRLRYARRVFRKDVEHLHKNNMIFQESSDLVIEDESEESKVEPASSDVDEEVIE